jgi:hypothetical protein
MSPCCLSKTPQEQDKKYQFDSLDVTLTAGWAMGLAGCPEEKLSSTACQTTAVIYHGMQTFAFPLCWQCFDCLVCFHNPWSKDLQLVLWLAGKATRASLRKLLREQDVSGLLLNLVDFYPVALAAVLDQII